MAVLIGTSGWQYRDWRGRLYPEGLRPFDWLVHYAARFATVEVNASFYRLPRPEVVAAWAERTPSDFVVAMKLSRYLSHVKRLRDPAEPVARFLTLVERLGAKAGPLLLQLPPRMEADAGLLEQTLGLIPRALRVAVEFRDASWYTPAVRSVLERRDAALCLADRLGEPLQPWWQTASWGYVRFHEGAATGPPCYELRVLDTWAGRIATMHADQDVYVYFNNDPQGCAPHDAAVFAGVARRHGLSPTRVPDRRDVPAGPQTDPFPEEAQP